MPLKLSIADPVMISREADSKKSATSAPLFATLLICRSQFDFVPIFVEPLPDAHTYDFLSGATRVLENVKKVNPADKGMTTGVLIRLSRDKILLGHLWKTALVADLGVLCHCSFFDLLNGGGADMQFIGNPAYGFAFRDETQHFNFVLIRRVLPWLPCLISCL